MSEVTCIGRCKGCDRMRRLDDGVCQDCLSGPNLGRVWAERMYKCRQDPEYARTVYASIPTERGRKLFQVLFPNFSPPVPTGTHRF